MQLCQFNFRLLCASACSILSLLSLSSPLRAHSEAAPVLAQTAAATAYQPVATGAGEIHFGPVAIKILVEAAALGSDEVEIGGSGSGTVPGHLRRHLRESTELAERWQEGGIYDFGLFYLNVRRNVGDRVAAYLRKVAE